MNDCLFCKITAGKINSSIRYEDKLIIAFDDINPKAPVHILIVPKMHIESTATLKEGDEELIGYMIKKASELAEQLNIASKGYRLVFNTRQHGGQFIDHLHLHLIGGQKLGGMV